MNRKVYKIWMLLLDKPGEWFYTEDIAFQMDLTRKQIYALLSKFPTPPVERERLNGEAGLRVRINGSEAYLKRVRDSITMDWFKIDEEVLDRVRNALPQAGEAALQTALDILTQACAGAGPEGLAIQEFSSGETAYDGDSRLLRKPAQAVCTAYLYAITEADGTFLDFEIRGERIP